MTTRPKDGSARGRRRPRPAAPAEGGEVAGLPPLRPTFPVAPRSLRESYSALREEYLKLRALAFNEHTQLPTHQAVVGEIKSRVSSAHSVAVLVVAVENLREMEDALGWRAADEILARATDAVRAFVAESGPPGTVLAQEDLSGEQVLLFVPRDTDPSVHSIADIERLAEELERFVSARLATLDVGEGRRGRLTTGYALLADSPFHRFERVVGRAVAAAQAMRRDHEGRGRHAQRLLISDVLARRSLTVAFQPIVDLTGPAIYGYEALCRGPRGTPFEVADVLFRTSQELGFAEDLDDLCRDVILGSGHHVPAGRKLFLNVLPESVETGRVDPVSFLERISALGLAPSDVVFEVAERSRVADYARFRRMLRPFREAGCLVALDDVGSGYSSLRLVPEVQPDFLKVDMSVVKDIDEDPLKQGVLATLGDLAARLSARVICEGIERPDELRVVVAHGVSLVQGFLIEPPTAQPVLTFSLPEA